MRITVEEIKKAYPRPVQARSLNEPPHREGSYCVGGALCMSLGGKYRFPASTCVAGALRKVNPNLRAETAKDLWFAERIIKYNDKGQFSKAWGYLEKALSYRPKAKA